jgi:ABC-type antimicrobial peptide transport system permease subunit
MALRTAFRSLLHQPGFTVVLVLILGLGIGATTTVWSFAYALLLRPYPYESPDALVRVQSVYTKESGARRGMSLLDLDDYRRLSTTIAGVGAYTVFDMRLLTDGPPVVVSAANINPDALSLLGVRPALGRLLLPSEDVPGGDVNKVVIAHDVWQSIYGSDRNVIGKTLRTDRETYTVVGVMPPGFGFPDRVGVWMPMEAWYSNLAPGDDRRVKWRGARWYATVARLAPGTTIEAAQSELNNLASALERDYPKDNDGVRIALTSLREFETGPVRPYLVACLAGVLLLLFVCCANIANLLLVRATTRRREIAVKAALGASQAKIARELIAESLLLGVAGAAAGVVFGWVGVRGLLALIPVPLPQWMRIEVEVAASYYIARTDGDPDAILDTIRRTITGTERTIAVPWVKTVERTMVESLWQRRMWGVLFTAFAALALGLAAVGIYGVISFAVAQRAREMGIRQALGATPGEVRRQIVREGMGLCTIGAVIGLAGAFVLGRQASSLLFGVTGHDGLTYALMIVTMEAIGLAACWVPAMRASRVHPVIALRAE